MFSLARSPVETPSFGGEKVSSAEHGPIVHVTARYPPGLGGVEKVVQYLARSQHKRGLTVSVITSDDGRGELADESEPFHVSRLRSAHVLHTPLMPGLLRNLLALDRHAVVHLHISHAYTPEMVWVYSRLTRRPYIAHFHGNLGPSGQLGRLLFNVYKRLVIGLVIGGAKAVVALTGDDKCTLVSTFGIDPSKVVVVRNGVDESFSYQGERDLHPKPRLLFVGRLAVQKNLELLLRALEGVSDQFETTIVGRGELEAELKGIVQELHLQNVRFYGVAHGSELRQLYRDADVFVLPSVMEGMPLVLLEAMAMGLPIVATDIPGTRDLVAHDKNGVLVPLDEPAALRDALLEVARDNQRYRGMSEAARATAGNYSWDAVVSEFSRIYAETHCR
jgi:glycosyltransferase involved in cell wall biosynthesis